MSRNSREQTARKALAARMSLQFDHALSQAARTLEACGAGWNDSGDDAVGNGVCEPGRDAIEDPAGELPPLELQLADLERAVNSILEQRDRVLYGYGNADGSTDVSTDVSTDGDAMARRAAAAALTAKET